MNPFKYLYLNLLLVTLLIKLNYLKIKLHFIYTVAIIYLGFKLILDQKFKF